MERYPVDKKITAAEVKGEHVILVHPLGVKVTWSYAPMSFITEHKLDIYLNTGRIEIEDMPNDLEYVAFTEDDPTELIAGDVRRIGQEVSSNDIKNDDVLIPSSTEHIVTLEPVESIDDQAQFYRIPASYAAQFDIEVEEEIDHIIVMLGKEKRSMQPVLVAGISATMLLIGQHPRLVILVGENHTIDPQDCPKGKLIVSWLRNTFEKEKRMIDIFIEGQSKENELLNIDAKSSISQVHRYNDERQNNIRFHYVDQRLYIPETVRKDSVDGIADLDQIYCSFALIRDRYSHLANRAYARALQLTKVDGYDQKHREYIEVLVAGARDNNKAEVKELSEKIEVINDLIMANYDTMTESKINAIIAKFNEASNFIVDNTTSWQDIYTLAAVLNPGVEVAMLVSGEYHLDVIGQYLRQLGFTEQAIGGGERPEHCAYLPSKAVIDLILAKDE